MALIDVFNINNEKVSEIELSDDIFGVEVKPHLLHQVVTMQLTNRRSGTASVKRRSDVRGSTRKLMRQKGTGNARRGDKKSPLLRGGGVVFGPSPKKYSYSVPKKVRKAALKMALSAKFKEKKLFVLDDFPMDEIKTKKFAEVLAKLGKKNVLIIINEKKEKLELSSRNIASVKVLRSEGLNVYDILKYEELLLIENSVKNIEGRLCR